MAKAVGSVVLSPQIPLNQWDEDGETYVVFQEPRRYEAEQLAHMQAQSVLEWNSDEVGLMRQRDRLPLAAYETAMVAMCLVGSNLTRVDEETGEESPVFVPGKSCRAPRKGLTEKIKLAFEKEWADLPASLAEEVVAKLREWHPPFNWRDLDENERD